MIRGCAGFHAAHSSGGVLTLEYPSLDKVQSLIAKSDLQGDTLSQLIGTLYRGVERRVLLKYVPSEQPELFDFSFRVLDLDLPIAHGLPNVP